MISPKITLNTSNERSEGGTPSPSRDRSREAAKPQGLYYAYSQGEHGMRKIPSASVTLL